jgi:hypothetical protein
VAGRDSLCSNPLQLADARLGGERATLPTVVYEVTTKEDDRGPRALA